MMYKICKTEHSAARQKELEQQLLKEMLLRHFDVISISDLCESSGIPRKAFYRYFSGKVGALHALIDHTLMDFDSFILNFDGHGEKSQQIQLEQYLLCWKRHRYLLDAIESSSLWEVLSDRVIAYTLQEFTLNNRQGHNAPTLEDTYTIAFITGGIMTVLHSWYQENMPDIADNLAGIILKNISGNNLLRKA